MRRNIRRCSRSGRWSRQSAAVFMRVVPAKGTHIRDMNSPVSVLILMISPGVRYSGTFSPRQRVADCQTMSIVQPLSESQRAAVVRATLACLARAEAVFQRAFPAVPVRFDLRGRAAGMYRVQRGARQIRYNPHIFAKYFTDSLAETVPHEVAHYVTDVLHGLRNVRPHGPEWRAVAQALGATPRATGHYDLSGIPLRRQTVFDYRCACARHRLGARRHGRVQRGEAGYVCRRCGTPLIFAGSAAGMRG